MTSHHPDAGRPALKSDDVLTRAAVLLCSDMGPEVETPDSVESVARALRHADDAYEIAKALDRDGWVIDDNILQSLLDGSMHLYTAHRAAVTEWVQARHIRPQRAVGEAVSFLLRGETKHGEITRVDADQATYCIFVPELGHVRQGAGTLGIIVPFEQVHHLCPAPESFELEAQGVAA